ncbi:cupin domain-containing protein [Eilatimonas milleporae]|uniref:Cupin domain-containing protein n=1 Tax=Eilatimonas milleporae TaxID=911205 RepID=A0A3M0C1N6_9PROT|nr:cupin domain-containing protein [Eilatimonas milleporae]RMB02785.1 Cupin domain-containing protein [Eilatimonas milleporae]
MEQDTTVSRVEDFPWGQMAWLMDDAAAESAGFSTARMTVLAGRTAGPHRHPNATEFLLVEKGDLTLRLTDETVPLAKGDTYLIPVASPHEIIAGPEGAQLTIFYNTPRRGYEAATIGS